MNIRTAILVMAALILLGLVSSVQVDGSHGITSIKAMASGISDGPPASWNSGPSMMQDDGESGDNGDEEAGGDDQTGGDEEAGGDEEGGGDEETPAEEETTGGMSDVLGQPVEEAADEEKLNNALAGIADYEVTYDTTKTREELTPQALRDLGVTYAGEESPVAQRTQALRDFDLLRTLGQRYEVVEDEYAADTEQDFAPEDPEHTFNYFQPRADPFIIPSLIPEELRPELSGTGLEGAVDPEVLRQLFAAQYEANLRLIPIIVVGVMEAGPTRIVLFTLPGLGYTISLDEGDNRCLFGGGMPPFSVTATRVSEDSVTLTLRGHYDYRCRYAATNPVQRTFHVNR
jgi:hypothetical protein